MRRRKYLRRTLLVGVAMVAVAGAILLWYAASDDLPPLTPMALLESIMPVYDVQEIHSTYVDAAPAKTFAAILAVTPAETALARPFLWVRRLPARVRGGERVDDGVWNRPFLSLSSTATLGREPDREIVIGLIGKFWKLRDAERVEVQSREQFMAFNTAGYALSTLSFHVDREGSGSRVTTITRVRTTDPESRRAFLSYWRVIGSGSAVLRRTWLRAVKARAERKHLALKRLPNPSRSVAAASQNYVDSKCLAKALNAPVRRVYKHMRVPIPTAPIVSATSAKLNAGQHRRHT